MITEPLTLAEAVPLGTVHLQRLLTSAGIRSLVIKGPAFVELGVRRPRQSNDIDLLIHRRDRHRATAALGPAGWTQVSGWVPEGLDDVVPSATYRHGLFPVTLDLHHAFAGLLDPQAFEVLWAERCSVELAGQPVDTLSVPCALLVESLNAIKAREPRFWEDAIGHVLDAAVPVDVGLLTTVADSLGARQSAAPLIAALGGGPSIGEAKPFSPLWASDGQPASRFVLAKTTLRRAPLKLPQVLWREIALDAEAARYWAERRGLPYKGRVSVLFQRLLRALRQRW